MCAKKVENKSFQAFSADMRNDNLKKVLFMYGPEQYLVKWAVESIKKKYVNQASEVMDFVVIEDEHIEAENIIEACETFSMFSEKRVIWVKDYAPLMTDGIPRGYSESSITSLIEYVEHSNDNALLIFSCERPIGKSKLVKAIKKASSWYEFVSLSRPELMSFAAKRFRSAGVEIKPAEMSMLINSTGYENKESDYRLYNFENDIMKVIAHAENGRVTEDDIYTVVDGDNATFVFDLLDGISGNNKSVAFEILDNRFRDDYQEAPKITAAIASQIETMYIIKEFEVKSDRPVSARQINEYTGINEYRIKKLMQYVNRYSMDKIRDMLHGIYESNRNIVTGVLDGQTALEMFIAKI